MTNGRLLRKRVPKEKEKEKDMIRYKLFGLTFGRWFIGAVRISKDQ